MTKLCYQSTVLEYRVTKEWRNAVHIEKATCVLDDLKILVRFSAGTVIPLLTTSLIEILGPHRPPMQQAEMAILPGDRAARK